MKKLITILGVFAVVLLAVGAQGDFKYPGTFKGPIFANVAAMDTDVSLLIRYVGTTPSVDDTVTVEADGNLTFKQNGVADTTLECPVAAPLGGIIDVSDGACNSIGEVVDIINASPDWEAVIVDGLRSDTSDNVWVAAGAADATQKAGLAILWEATTKFSHVRALTNKRTFDAYFPAEAKNGKVLDNAFFGTYSVLESVTWNTNYDAGTSALTVYAVVPTRGGETVTTLWPGEVSGATDVTKTLGPATWPYGLIAPLNAKIVYKVINSADLDTGFSSAYALEFQR